MKKGNFYLGAFVALAMGALVGCSKDDGESAKVTPEMTTSFANISIVMPNHAGTRAEGDGQSRADGGYENGTPAENKIKKLLLVFYDAQGNVVGNAVRENIEGEMQDKGNPIETIYSNTVQITLNEGANMPASVMAYVNPANTSSQNDRLDAVRELKRDADQLADENKGFLMNNSGHYEGGVYTLASPMDATKIYTSAEEAKGQGNAAEIYVERVAAKVKVALADNAKIGALKATDTEGTEYTLTFVPESWGVTATEQKTMLLKNLNSTVSSLNSAFPAGTNWILPAAAPYRTFWARSYSYGVPGEVTGSLDIGRTSFPVVGDDDGTFRLDYLTYASQSYENLKNGETNITLTNAAPAYIAENTMRNARFNNPETYPNPYASVTSAIIKGHYDVEGTGSEKFDGGFYIRKYTYVNENGTSETRYNIYTEKELIEAMSASQPIFRTGENDAELADGAIALAHLKKASNIKGELEPNPANRVTIQIPESYTGDLYIPTTDDTGKTTWTNAGANREEINAALEKFAGQAMHYNARHAFFYVPIKHNGAGNEAFIKDPKTGDYGIVRNHSYQVTVNSINGLAIGVADDSHKLLPEPTPTQTYYINATMNVLAWHIMGQSVDL